MDFLGPTDFLGLTDSLMLWRKVERSGKYFPRRNGYRCNENASEVVKKFPLRRLTSVTSTPAEVENLVSEVIKI